MTDDFSDPHLDAQLRTLRDQSLHLETPRAVEDVLLAALAHRHRPRWYRFAWPRWSAGVGLTGLAAMVFAAMLWLAAPTHTPPSQSIAGVDNGDNFIALDSAERIAREPAPRLVETDVSRIALASLGVPLSPDNAGELIRAQFLVSADGHPLALRLLPLANDPDKG